MDILNNVWGLPYYYKNIPIYPIKMLDCSNFYKYVNCLLLEKNKSQDIQIIKMSYLYFLFYIGYYAKDENGNKFDYLLLNLDELMKLVFKQDYKIDTNKNNIFFKLYDVNKKEVFLSEQDFDHIRNIIFKQNLVKYSEDILDPEIEQKIKEAEEFLANRNNDNATIEENIFSFAASMNKIPSEIAELTIYQFNKILERKNLLKTWEVFSYPALKSGEQDKIKHWLSHIPEKGLYDHITISMEEFNRMTSDSGIFSKT